VVCAGQVKFEKGSVATPELLQDIELPSSITVLGQPVDLSPLKTALQPVESIAQGAVRQLAALLAQQPDLQFPISGRQAQTWLINTYLDEVPPPLSPPPDGRGSEAMGLVYLTNPQSTCLSACTCLGMLYFCLLSLSPVRVRTHTVHSAYAHTLAPVHACTQRDALLRLCGRCVAGRL
jgi:hypothetical protein